MFNHAKNVVVSGGTFSAVSSNKTPLEILYESAAPGAFHVSAERYDAPKCHPDTRIAVIEDIMQQITTVVASCILWLYGAAGAGKSSIAQSIAELCSEQNLLIGSFFFFRASPLRNNWKRLAASLAYQLAQSIPFTLPHIAACITTNPAIFESSLQEQITKLFVQPLCKAFAEHPALSPQPKLIILDGLDECDKPGVQQHILTTLARVLQGTPLPIVVLVASRPETHIATIFESPDELSNISTSHMGLNNEYDSDNDIRIFLNSKFSQMKRSHPFKQYIPIEWPSTVDIEYIVQKASGQFIFPATIIRYVEFGECKPHEQLRNVVDGSKRFASQLGDSPFKEIDALYLHIFSGVRNVVLVLSMIFIRLDLHRLAANGSSHPRTIETHLRLEPGDVHMHLSALASLMKFEGDDQPIRLFHASLEDFLIDESRSRGFYILQPKVYAYLSNAYIRRVLEPGITKQAPLGILRHAARNLQFADFDEDLSESVAELEARISGLIEAFQSGVQVISLWDDNDSKDPSKILQTFPDLVDNLHTLDEAIAKPSSLFWPCCLEAIQNVFRRDLSVYLTDETTHDFLALMAFTETHVLISIKETEVRLHAQSFPPLLFIAEFGIMPSSAWRKCLRAHPFVGDHTKLERPSSLRCSDILRHLLLDPGLSEELVISKKRCARVALKCLSMITSTTLDRDVGTRPFNQLPDDQVSYLWAVWGLTSTLRLACEDRSLIDALKTFDYGLRWLKYYEQYVTEAREAINTYLNQERSSLETTKFMQSFNRLRR